MGDVSKLTILVSVALASVDSANAAVQPVKPETHATLPEKPLEREADTVPCLRSPERPRTVWWTIIGPDGEIFIIGERDIRQMC